MFAKLRHILATKEIRNSLLFVLFALAVYRLAAHVPVPGIDATRLQAFFEGNQVLGLLNLFSGGSIDTFSVVALGVGPYITASIIMQLLGMIVPRIEEIQKEGSTGQQRLNRWTRWLTVPLAALQAYSIVALLRQSQLGIIGDLSGLELAGVIITMIAGSLFLMWLGELISEKKVGNGVSLIIFAGIVSRLPQVAQQLIVSYDPSQLMTYVAFAAIAVLIIAGVIFITEGQRNIPVIYAKRMMGGRLSGGAESKLPLRVNMAGVIPIIFAVSLVLFPPMVAQFFVNAKTVAVADAARAVIAFFQDRTVYAVLYTLLVFFFTYFYTTLVFKPEQVAENIQKQGGYVPGVRPGKPTAEYLMWVLNRITPAGAIFLATIAVMPYLFEQYTGTTTLAIGGTSVLIVVSVVIELVNQINAKLTSLEYDRA
jgi:preprotein translocase subunit SecY